MSELYTYKPLPANVTIKESIIEGLGLFTKDSIKENVVLGTSHYDVSTNMDQELVRTPLGGFINHSITPNCSIERKSIDWGMDYQVTVYVLKTTTNIDKNVELTLDYIQVCNELGLDYDLNLLK